MQIERRSSTRVVASGSVFVDVPGGARGRIVDLSASGVRFQLSIEEPSCTAGAPIALELRLDGTAFGWFRFGGVVTRTGNGEIAVAFTEVPRAFAQAIREELLSVAASESIPQVLIVDPVSGRRVLVAAALHAAGCMVAEASTPLEAITYLDDSMVHPWIVAIADTVPSEIADQLRGFVLANHVLVKLVAISEHPGDPGAEGTRLALDDPPALNARVARLLASPIK